MSNQAKLEEKPANKAAAEKKAKKSKSGYVSWWLFRSKGTVAEPWPAAEELWNDPDVQRNIKEVKKAFAEAKESQKKQTKQRGGAMSNQAKLEEKPANKATAEKKAKKSKSGYVSWRLFRSKGTVAEPWPTAEELWNDPDVQREIKEMKDAFSHIKPSQAKSS